MQFVSIVAVLIGLVCSMLAVAEAFPQYYPYNNGYYPGGGYYPNNGGYYQGGNGGYYPGGGANIRVNYNRRGGC